jgi:hypothetical protein
MTRFILDLGGCLDTRAYLASPRIISIRAFVKRLELVSGRELRDTVHVDFELRRLPHLHWSDVSSLMQSQPVSIMTSLRFQCFTTPLRIVNWAQLGIYECVQRPLEIFH